MSTSIKGINIYINLKNQSLIESHLLNIKAKIIEYKAYALNKDKYIIIYILSDGAIKITDIKDNLIENIEANPLLKTSFGTGEDKTNPQKYTISDSGSISVGGRIMYKDDNGNFHKITITPGDEVIRLYTPYKIAGGNEEF